MRFASLLLLAAACAAPDPNELFNAIEVVQTDAAGVSDRFVAAIDSAHDSLVIPGENLDAPAEILEGIDRRARIVPDRIPHRIHPQYCRSP